MLLGRIKVLWELMNIQKGQEIDAYVVQLKTEMFDNKIKS